MGRPFEFFAAGFELCVTSEQIIDDLSQPGDLVFQLANSLTRFGIHATLQMALPSSVVCAKK